MIKNELIEIIKSNSKIDRNFNYEEVRVITDDNILDIVDNLQLLIKKHIVELETKVEEYNKTKSITVACEIADDLYKLYN